jgi:hypothetical protein
MRARRFNTPSLSPPNHGGSLRPPVLARLLIIGLAVAIGRAGEPSGKTLFAGETADFFEHWFDRVAELQSEQPRWVTPLVTFSPRLGEEYRYDQLWQTTPAGRTTLSLGGNKGVGLIPFRPVELFVGVPSWQTYGHPAGHDGWGDENILVKIRLASGNATNGDYVVSMFMGFGIPSGSAYNSSGHMSVTPWISAGKGWGPLDVQSSLGVTVPDYGAARWGNGTPVLWNTTFQGHFMRYLWPELEFNYTWWPDGLREGRSQLYLTPGIVLGKFPIWRRLSAVVGAGRQTAVTSHPVNDHAWILSVRAPF